MSSEVSDSGYLNLQTMNLLMYCKDSDRRHSEPYLLVGNLSEQSCVCWLSMSY